MTWKRIGTAGALLAVAIAVYLEFVQDVRTPRAELIVAGVVGASQPNRPGEVIGVTLVGGIGGAPFGLFPFRIGPNAVPEPTPNGALVTAVENRFKNIINAGSFQADHFAIEGCRNFPAAELGLRIAGPLLRLGRSTLCTVVWKRTAATRMLVGITAANGGVWIRPFTRGICRTLAGAWLRKTSQTAGATASDFLQCIVADRPNSPTAPVSSVVYQVGADGSLALTVGASKVVSF